MANEGSYAMVLVGDDDSEERLYCEHCGSTVCEEDFAQCQVCGRDPATGEPIKSGCVAIFSREGETFTMSSFIEANAEDLSLGDWVKALEAMRVGESITLAWDPITRVS